MSELEQLRDELSRSFDRRCELRKALELAVTFISGAVPQYAQDRSEALDVLARLRGVLAHSADVASAPASGWIPVTERLPTGEDAVSCEAWCLDADDDHPGPCIMMYDAEADEGERWQAREDTGCWTPGEVTHWRPRPAGPSGVLASQSAQPGIHIECHECHNCGHIGINDSHPTDASCSECDWTGPSPKEDHCPGCGKDGTMHLACPKCSHRYHTIAEATVGVALPRGGQPE